MKRALTVVVPMLNEAGGVRATLEALAAQRDTDFDVVFVDNGSTDGTASLARRAGATVVREETGIALDKAGEEVLGRAA